MRRKHYIKGEVLTDSPERGSLNLWNLVLSVLKNSACCIKEINDGQVIMQNAGVTQLTSKTTAVTSDNPVVRITTVALTDAADTNFSFTINNSYILSSSVVLASVDMNGGTGFANITITPSNGSAVITVRNVGTAAFNSAIKIGIVVM
jgi:hypothetical protein